MADVEIRLPFLEEIARRWNEIEPLLKDATDRTECYEPIDILRLTMAGSMWIHLVDEPEEYAPLAVVVSGVRQYPRARVYEVPFIAGRKLSLWHKPLLATLDAHARVMGCTSIMGFDRKGWTKFGFRQIGVILQRDLA